MHLVRISAGFHRVPNTALLVAVAHDDRRRLPVLGQRQHGHVLGAHFDREGDVGVEVLELAAGEVGEDRGAEVARGRHGREGGEDGEEFHSFRSFNNEHKVAGAGGWSGGNRS